MPEAQKPWDHIDIPPIGVPPPTWGTPGAAFYTFEIPGKGFAEPETLRLAPHTSEEEAWAELLRARPTIGALARVVKVEPLTPTQVQLYEIFDLAMRAILEASPIMRTPPQWLTERKRHSCVYLDNGDLKQAVASMASEITRHGWTPGSWGYAALVSEGLRLALHDDAKGVRRWIDGF